MSPDLEQQFYSAFPELFRGRCKPKEESSMCFGLNCNDKWFEPLWQHCQAIELLAQKEGRNRQSHNWPEALQVKEKCGSLRVYIANESDAMRELRLKLIADTQT